MSKKLANHQINYILLQLIAFTFVCIMSFVNYMVDDEIQFLRIGLQTFSVLLIVLYEIIIYVAYVKANKSQPKEIKRNYNEKYLWFEILTLIDILILVALISQVTKQINIAIHLTIGFIIYYIISVLIRPYFGINHKK